MGGRDRNETLRHWQRVRAPLGRVPDSPETLALGVLARAQMIRNGFILGRTADAAAVFAEGIDLAERLGHPEARGPLLMGYGSMRFFAGAIEEALTHYSEAVRLAEQSGNDVLRFLARFVLCNVLVVRLRLRGGLAITEEGETLDGGGRAAG